MRSAGIVCFWLLAALVVHAARGEQQSDAYLNPAGRMAAVDAKGVRHQSTEYSGGKAPWVKDQIKMVAPAYPAADRYQVREGRGIFVVSIDPRTGRVTNVLIQTSTGFPTLDKCAVEALRQWMWKPGTWREVTLPVTFTMHPGLQRLQRNAIKLH